MGSKYLTIGPNGDDWYYIGDLEAMTDFVTTDRHMIEKINAANSYLCILSDSEDEMDEAEWGTGKTIEEARRYAFGAYMGPLDDGYPGDSYWDQLLTDQILCGGCGLIIREVNEGVWVRGGSDECEAGGVHSPPSKPSPLTEIYLIREQNGSWFAGGGSLGWTRYINGACVFPDNDRPLPANSYWVRFVEAPF